MKPAAHTPRWQLLGVLLALLTLAFFIYRSVINATFLWDDEFLVIRNPLIRSPILAGEVFHHFLFTDARGEFYRPVQNLSYIFDYWRAGLDAPAFHQTNLLLHSLNAFLVFAICRRLIRNLSLSSENRATWLALSVAVFWLIHPVHSAITAYVSGRADSLALLGLLVGWLSWEESLDRPSRMGRTGLQLIAALAVSAGCFSKEIALAGLGLFLLYVVIFRSDLRTVTRFRTALAVGCLFGVYLIFRHFPDPNVAPASAPAMALSERLILCFRAMGDYARLMVYPGKLFMERQVNMPTGLFTDPVKSDPLFTWLGVIGGLAVATLTASLFWRGDGRRLRLLGFFWFAVMILPVSNLFTLNATVAEHWLYIPSIGLCLWAAGCWIQASRYVQRVSLFAFPLLLVLLGLRAQNRAAEWRDPVTFYLATIRAGGDSIRVRLNLAAEFQKQGRLIEGERIYRSILAVSPDLALAKVSLARNLILQKRNGEASSFLDSNSSGITGGTAEKVATLEMLTQAKDFDHAERMARQSYEARPNSWPLAKALAGAYLAQKKTDAAMAVVRGFAGRNWWHAESHIYLGDLAVSQGFSQVALEAYLAAGALDIRDADSLSQAAVLLSQTGHKSEALRIQEKAVARDSSERQLAILRAIEGADSAKTDN